MKQIEEFLTQIVAITPAKFNAQYKSPNDYVLQHGHLYESAELTRGERAILGQLDPKHYKVRQCYNNAQSIAISFPEFSYVEGIATGVIPVDHAWVELNGKVIDMTWGDDGPMEDKRRREDGSIDLWFWSRKAPKTASVDDDDEDELEATFTDSDAPLETAAEVPVHPFCATFDLRRHLRLKLHVNYLTEYEYDQSISERLILPDVTKALVETLIQQGTVDFADVIAGKGGGAAVLLTGVPGVGKTLTAEVFSESSERPLYSIQAAQLGIKPDTVEQNLIRFLARGSRWNAVVLIDEADVYIRARDRDMEHNAIVAAFLRVLEYQTSTLFMTTNLADSVDDAIASRCVARINYAVPTTDFQKDIWEVMVQANSVGLSPREISQIVKKHPHLTGRDIKQLVKLATLVAANHGGAVTPETIDFVSQLQPTKNGD